MASGRTVEMGRGEILEMLRRRKWWAILPVLVILPTIVSVSLSLPKVYRASAIVLIERQQIPSDLVRSSVTSALELRLQTISQEILSRSRIESLVEKFHLYEDMRRGNASADEIVEQMRRDIDIELQGDRGRRSSGRGTVALSVS
jgi:succinoglycan biosynthesis transport protein ExoP